MKYPSEKSRNEITSKRNCQGLIIGTTHYQGIGCDEELHFHESPTICFMLSGGGIEKRRREAYERYACDARFYYAAEPHQSNIKVLPSKCINLEFEKGFLRDFGISENVLSAAVEKSMDIKFAMLKMYQEILTGDDLTNPSIQMLLFELLEGANNSRRKRPEWITDLFEMLNDRWTESLSLEELAAAVGVHPVTISKHFRQYFSCTLGEYMRKLKIEKSIGLIKNTKSSLTEIGLRCGFADQSHFTRNFKQMTGFTPKDFRRL